MAPVDRAQVYKRTIRDLIAGREVSVDAAREAMRWLRADAHIVATASGSVRLRVPVFPRSVSDLRGAGA